MLIAKVEVGGIQASNLLDINLKFSDGDKQSCLPTNVFEGISAPSSLGIIKRVPT